MRLILLLLLSTYVFAEDYSRLKEYKEKNYSDSNNSRLQSQSFAHTENMNKMTVRFRDINSFNFAYFEKVYKVNLLFCVAHGICIFENKSEDETNILIEKIKRDRKDISEIKLHQNYKMRPF